MKRSPGSGTTVPNHLLSLTFHYSIFFPWFHSIKTFDKETPATITSIPEAFRNERPPFRTRVLTRRSIIQSAIRKSFQDHGTSSKF